MTNLTTPPRSIFRQIQANLKDRYATGFPVLKELIQNAEDARASRIRFVAHDGWKDATNPLLRVPGLLIVNDGRFEAKDKRGVLSFADSAKGDETEAIGRFGFGQKAVFHLCDAFVAHAFGHSEEFSEVINPCLGVIDNTQAESWDVIGQEDLARLSAEASGVSKGFLLWLPLRRDEIMPAPKLSFTNYQPSLEELVNEFIDHTDELQLILSSLRHLDRISVQVHGEDRIVLSRGPDSRRMQGPGKNALYENQSFQGTIESLDGNLSTYIGREACGASPRLEKLQKSDTWPQVPVFTEKGEEVRPEKAVAHGAVIITDRVVDAQDAIDINWGVFLPVTRATRLEPSVPSLLILLHGYFFVDSGRRYIEGFDNDNDEVDGSSIYRNWNKTLRNEVVLPLLPSALNDAFQAQMMSSNQLAEILASLRNNRFGRVHAGAIARRDCLIRAVEPSNSGAIARWVLKQSDASLRPLPHPDEHGRIKAAEIFPDLCGWAEKCGLTLFAGAEAALIRDKAEWQSDELTDLLTGLSADVFQQGGRVDVLASFLKVAVGEDKERREAAAEPLLTALRRSLIGTEALGSVQQIRDVLAHLPEKTAVALPKSAGAPRDVMRALAEVYSAPLCLRSEWLSEGTAQHALSTGEAGPLIAALQPLLSDHRNAEAAGTAALTLVKLLGLQLLEAAKDPQIASLSILRAGNGSGKPQLVSLAELIEASQERRLFKDSPDVQRALKAMDQAVLGSGVLVLRGEAARLLEEIGEPFKFGDPKRENFVQLVMSAKNFGPADARARAIVQVYNEVPGARRALRSLAAGNTRASGDTVQLFALPHDQGCLDDLALRLIEGSDRNFLVPNVIAETLTIPQQRYLGIKLMDGPALGQLLNENVEEIPEIALDDSTIVSLLETDIPDEDLRRLPIFPATDGRRWLSSEIWQPSADWPVPYGLVQTVPILKPLSGRKVAERLKRLVATWSPETQLLVALAKTEPHIFWREVLATLDQLKSAPPVGLSQVKWLVDRQGRAWAPSDLLDLPEEVLIEARQLFDAISDLPFLPLSELAHDLRDDPGFKALRSTGVIPDKDGSIDALLLMVEEVAPRARLCATEGEIFGSLVGLAKEGADLRLPGWPLLATLLRLSDPDLEKLLPPFGIVSKNHVPDAVAHMNALAELDENGSKDARRIYLAAFQTVCTWPADELRNVMKGIRVPVEAGDWKTADAVAAHIQGISAGYRLAKDLEKLWPGSLIDCSTAVTTITRSGSEPKLQNGSIAIQEKECAQSLEKIIKLAQANVPPDLLALLVGIVRQTNPFRSILLADIGLSESVIDRIWGRIRGEVDEATTMIGPGQSLRNIRQKTFVSYRIETPKTIEVTTLASTRAHLATGAFEPLLVIGDGHRRRNPIKLDEGDHWLRQVTVSDTLSEVKASDISRLILTLAKECFGHKAENLESLESLINDCSNVDQSTVADAQARLEDRLPQIIAELKPPPNTKLRLAFNDYEREEDRMPPGKQRILRLPDLKRTLWEEMETPEARREILLAIRNRIEDYGYSPDRVLFELFQNADDASLQHPPPGKACFRLEVTKEQVRALHWGRLINHPGPDPRQGDREGWLRDLFNMLLMNLSEKREGVTGRFGLGFKSVHLIAADVGIASGFVACRVNGGMLPEVWERGQQISLDNSVNGRRATVIELVLDQNSSDQADNAVQSFRTAARWLPAMSHTIRRIELSGSERGTWEANHRELAKGIGLVTLSGASPGRALSLELGEETTLFLVLSSDGPVPAEEGLPRLWLLAPLAETLKSGWLMNGRSFRVDPGRGSLKRGESEPQDTFAGLGVALGERLIALADLVHDNWADFAVQSGLVDESPETGPATFWSKLSDLFALDLDDPLACHLHSAGRGYGRLISERVVLPTGLSYPFAALIRAENVQYYLEGVMSEPALQADLREWKVLEALGTTCVKEETALRLERLGFSRPFPISLSEAIKIEIGAEKRVEPALAKRLGSVLTDERLERLNKSEEQKLLQVISSAQYRMLDDTWREARLPPREAADADEEEYRIVSFAPDEAVAHSDYSGAALVLYRLAMRQSGFQRTPTTFVRWAQEMTDVALQRAILQYILEGRQGSELGGKLAQNRPSWLPEISDDFRTSPQVDDIADTDLPQLLGLLYPVEQRRRWGQDFGVDPSARDFPEATPRVDSVVFLKALHEWWSVNANEQRAKADTKTYPDGFSPSSLIDKTGNEDREGWFTFFALAVFRTIGWNNESAHGNFIAKARQAGWWREIATARLPDDPSAWIARLEDFAKPDVGRIDFPQWRRALVDLYLLARWLPEYVEALQALPAKVEDNGHLSLSDAFRLSSSPLWQRLGLEGAPLSQSLGIGANWLIREGVRHGVWQDGDARMVHPYAWASTRSVRERILERLDLNLGEKANMDFSRDIHEFIEGHIGDKVSFLGDLDLPLQIASKNESLLQGLFDGAELASTKILADEDKETYS
ncbi:sacsin N-terminal ATP-binding-like domain-containing protein [Falsihalocynthiibacter arcticus]|uniref:Sacsin/Nov domain-containing protein n=1 Tax=Falsihalocynthiibacter arcticus TaxID=1579316 RepID=A0A126V077_9RHOB|nr:hypothetical protein [Falsihalocynthiibacter arcticus]AML51732.1 hypothetical protein RC74_11070 [Falsihalocynthiibacter arcticus]